MASKYQVMLSIEIMDTPFINSITKFLEYDKICNSPWLTVYPDLGNLTALGKDAKHAVYNAVVLEELSKMAYRTIQINPNIKSVEKYLLDKHYFRKHGKNAYYGQN